jgi:transcriptional regulator with XRE-family HTH domain
MDNLGVRRTVNLAVELKRWRNRRGMSYRGLAELVGYEHSQLWKIEHGRANLTRDLALACDAALHAGGALVRAWERAQGSVRPAQLPIAPCLVGRDAELAALRAGARDRPVGMPAVVAIDGPAGVGKTALALRWAHQVTEDYVDGQLYADLRAFAPPGQQVSVEVVLERFLTALGATSIPASTAERAALYRSLLVGRRALVVLDNVADVGDIEQLLPASAECAVVVTSRRALSGLVARVAATRVTLRPLAEPDAIALLSRVIGDARARAEAAAVAAVARLCGCLPLALQMAAELIATSPRRPVADLVDGLIEDDSRLGDLRAVFSWSYHDLGRKAARVFRLMGLHRGPHLSVAAVAALADIQRPQARRLLHRLASLHLVDIDSEEVVRMHDVVRVYARELAATEDDDEHRAAAVRRLVGWYAATLGAASLLLAPHGVTPAQAPLVTAGIDAVVFGDDAEAGAWCDTEQANLRPVITMARDYGSPEAAEYLAACLEEVGLFDPMADDTDGTLGCPLRTQVPVPRAYGGMRGEDDHDGPAVSVPAAATPITDRACHGVEPSVGSSRR